METRPIAQCHHCKEPVIQGQSFLCLKHPTKNVYLFVHVRLEEPIRDCSEHYVRKNGAAVPIFDVNESIT